MTGNKKETEIFNTLKANFAQGKNSVRKFLYKILLSVNILFALALLIAYMAVHINPEKFALPAFFGLAYPYLLMVNILISITWAVLLRFEAFISVVVIAAGFTHLTNYLRIGRPRADKQGTFKVISYNVRLFNSFEPGNKSSENKVFAFLKNQKPDILMIQEFYVNGDPVKKDQEVKSALGGGYYSHLKVFGSGKNRYFGIATYSRFPIVRKGEIIHPGSSSLSIFTDVVIRNDTFRIFNNHLQSYHLKKMERSFLEDMMAAEDKETINRVRSLSMSLRRGFITRARQAESVKSHINHSPYPVIVAGDFNDTPVSYSYRKIRNGLNDSFVESGYGAGFTYRGNYPANRIDYILYDKSLTSRYFEIIKVRYSDHYPIAAYFRKAG